MEGSDCRVFLFKYQMAQYINNNKHIKHIEKYVKNCRYSCVCVANPFLYFPFYNFSIGDWFVLYQMNKNMNKRFFAEFVALLSMKVEWRGVEIPEIIQKTMFQVNPEPDEEDDPEISVGGVAGRTEDNDEDYYDIDETGTTTGGTHLHI